MKFFGYLLDVIITDDYDPLPDGVVSLLTYMARPGKVARSGVLPLCVAGTIEALERKFPARYLTAEEVAEYMPLNKLLQLHHNDAPGHRENSVLGQYIALLPGVDAQQPLRRPPGWRALRAHRRYTTRFLMTYIRLTLHHHYRTA